MLNKLINMAKQEGMFDTAFLLASKYNLDNILYDNLRKDYNVPIDKLKDIITKKTINDTYMLDIHYNLINLHIVEKSNIHLLDISNNTKLEVLKCEFKNVKEINLSKNINLKKIMLLSNELQSLVLNNNPNLKELIVAFNKIEYLNLSNNHKLTHLNCNFNYIKNIYLFNACDLEYLDCSNNLIKRLDLSKNLKLKKISIKNINDINESVVILNKVVESKIEIYKDKHTEIIYVK